MPVRISRDIPDPLRSFLLVLNLRWPTTPQLLQAAFRKRALRTHPDRGGSGEAYKEVEKARDFVTRVLAGEILPQGEPEEEESEPEEWVRPEEGPSPYYSAFRDFVNGFMTSRNGNQWRRYNRYAVTVFVGGSGFRWCISVND